MSGRIYVEDVTPVVAAGRYPAKAVVGEHVPVTAAIWREGHDAAGATVVWRGPGDRSPRQTRLALVDAGADRWSAAIVPDAPGPWTFRVDAWSDPWSTWEHAVRAKLEAGQGPEELANDLATGVWLLRRAALLKRPREERDALLDAAAVLADESLPPGRRVAPALAPAIARALWERPLRELVTKGETHELWVDRDRALFGSWYEFFPRSTGGWDAEGTPVHGTLATAAESLDRIAAMGFDVVYLPPIHPIGEVNRKGRNNTLTAEPGDVGSPWAIGSRHGGHDAVHPDLGTLVDFKDFVERAHDLGLEVALDLALQCAPDHPWVAEHPEWFTTRPDGTIAYAENPPKKYQDIYPLNFDNDPEGLRAEILRVVTHWIDYGVRIFRVDNPHTKPPDFWHWLVWEVKRRHPDVLFLAEAFTRPARLYGLARLGFDQSYTYFTWRDTKSELTDFGREIAAHAHESRPNLFVTTPDILPTSLQLGLPAMSALRAALAATLSPTWGVYSGFELHEHEALPGREEFLDSEKYELRPRDFERARAEGRSLEPWLTKLNAIRRAHPALRQLRELTFHDVDNDALIAYSKTDPATGDTVVCVVTLDPHTPQEGTLRLDLAALGLQDRFPAHDEVTGQTWRWGAENYVRLDPATAVAHIVDVGRPARRPSEGA
ncbi:maltotransferase domain-containing protein [Saccharothrix variisporea]|uniref:Alpha-1,4-glucan:maltose-1-phosphate maltosyltransferase n=1 Tax=Saccharothrix variisporea TaxID=543527 RepID=A0A495X2L0_9PSEU|nr:maltotransferase domain-containing protein [Saccharothrix variisporea]RKT68210.1 alpha-1,4-glucan:maltose-1-phosphate maltosyltransferase [Saccharothrix variisporea]